MSAPSAAERELDALERALAGRIRMATEYPGDDPWAMVDFLRERVAHQRAVVDRLRERGVMH